MRPAQPVLVIDTNVWLDLLVFGDGSVARLRRTIAAGATCLASDAMREELRAVLMRSRFALDEASRARALAAFDASIRRVAEAPDCRLACSDPDDRKFLDLAVGHRAHWLLSRDKALLRARRHALGRFDLRIGAPLDFYNWLDSRTAVTTRSGSFPRSEVR
jgi:putative PIN family toxin of toxin-antitoxin system